MREEFPRLARGGEFPPREIVRKTGKPTRVFQTSDARSTPDIIIIADPDGGAYSGAGPSCALRIRSSAGNGRPAMPGKSDFKSITQQKKPMKHNRLRFSGSPPDAALHAGFRHAANEKSIN